ncbi:DUF7681 family protein [Streptomyces auratus]|uniref:Acb2/Tad1 hairpin domain-containing protein n=1 Tax=Streptomyces auratus AGR0001 TaxID=1160718 RepID=J2K2W5_9ACTN|nr:hypothetical protein [Streptomyces auratus]QTZ93641.1 hypothetical protein SU9_021090 [Streptomyces auratus AGR0001]
MTYEEICKRFDHHPPRCEQTAELHALVRAEVKRMAVALNEQLPGDREKSVVFMKLEEVLMWANASIARGCCLCVQPTLPPNAC